MTTRLSLSIAVVLLMGACAVPPSGRSEVHEPTPPATWVHPWQTTTSTSPLPAPACIPGSMFGGGRCW